MNVLKKSKSMVAVMALLAIALVSCQEEVDVKAPLSGIADKKIPASYSYTVIDTASFTATVYEYTFVAKTDSTPDMGSYLVTQLTGTGESLREEKPFTYVKGNLTEDNLYYTIHLTFEDGTEKDVLWGSASILDGEMLLNGPKRADHLVTIAGALPNVTWEGSSIAYYVDEVRDTIPYLNFIATIDTLSQSEIDAINAYLKSEEGKEYIAWFNDHLEDLGLSVANKVTLDTVRILKDLGDDAIRVRYFYWENDTIVKKSKDTLGISEYVESTMALKMQEGVANTGEYTYMKRTYTRAYYTEGDASGLKEETNDMTLTHWGVAFNGSLLNGKTLSVIAEVAGKDEIQAFRMSGLDGVKGSVTIDDLKYTVPTAE